MASIFDVLYYIFIDANTSKSTRVSKSIWSRYHIFKAEKTSKYRCFLLFHYVRKSALSFISEKQRFTLIFG